MLYHVLFESHDAMGARSDQGESREGDEVSAKPRMQETVVCRFCHSEEASEASLITPCGCKGSMRYVHPECLSNWRKTSGKARDQCTLCGKNYVYSPWDIACCSSYITKALFVVVMSMTDYNALFFDPDTDVSDFTFILFTVLQLWYIVHFWSQVFTDRIRRYVNNERVLLVGTCLLSIGAWIVPWYKMSRLTGIAMLYEVIDLFVIWLVGQPRLQLS